MIHWGKCRLAILFLASYLVHSPSYCLGSGYADPCDCPCWVTGFEVLAEFLYLRPQVCDLGYVICDERPFGEILDVAPAAVDAYLPSGRRMGLWPDYEPAFRVGVGYLVNEGCNDLRITYTGLWIRDSQVVHAVGNGGLWIATGSPRYHDLRLNNGDIASQSSGAESALPLATARQSVHIEHNSVDAVVAMRRWYDCCLWFRGFGGIRWADICVRENVDYSGVVTFVGPDEQGNPLRIFSNQLSHVHSKSDIWGIGTYFGGGLRRQVMWGLGIDLHIAAALLVGRSSHHMVELDLRGALLDDASDVNNVSEELNLHERGCWQLVPNVEARLGLSYLHRFRGCFDLCLESGWEFVTFINALSPEHLIHHGGNRHQTCRSFNLQGLYLALRLTL